jgi:hypothetical protein
VVLYVKIFYLKSVVIFMVNASSLRYCLWLMVHHGVWKGGSSHPQLFFVCNNDQITSYLTNVNSFISIKKI